MKRQQQPLLETLSSPRHKYLELDGLRGIAALSVVLRHTGYNFFGYAIRPFWLRQTFLAVDFFLVLSGFIIAYAYEDRLKSTGYKAIFYRERIIRLYPLLILGAIGGAIAVYIFQPDISGKRAILLWCLGFHSISHSILRVRTH